MEIEGFEHIISSLVLAKELHDIDRFDIVEQQFFDMLCWDSYYENILGVISSIFSSFQCEYAENDEAELMGFEDDVISNYFVYAWEYGMLNKLHYNKNPYVTLAQNEVQRWLNCNSCVDWKLLAYIRTKKSAQQSRLLVRIYTSCGCNAQENIAYGLIKLYAWFRDKCAEFKVLEAALGQFKEDAPVIRAKSELSEVMAA